MPRAYQKLVGGRGRKGRGSRRKARRRTGRKNGSGLRPFPPSCPSSLSALLRENLHDDATVLRAAGPGLVRGNRLLLAVADHVHLVQRNLVLLVEIPLHRLRPLETDAIVSDLVTDAVGVALDLDEDVLRILLELRNHLVETLLRFIGQQRLAELEVALIFAQHDLVDEPAVSLVHRVDAAADLGGGAARR